MGCNQSTAKETQETQTYAPGARRESIFENSGLMACVDGAPTRRKVTHICLTGGPCAGKSTAMSDVQTRFEIQFGIKVYCVPEAATMMVTGGMSWADISDETRTEFQLALLKAQIALEDTFLAIAKASGKPSVVISDRGTMDGRAFCSAEQFNAVLTRGNFNLEQLRDRYDAVIHMVTAAKGKPEHYNMDNAARQESAEGAVIADDNLRKCYIGHSNIIVFDNSTTFQKKLDRVFDSIGETCGVTPVEHHRTRRYLTRVPDSSSITVPYVNVTVTVTVLTNSTPDVVRMVMRRGQGENSVYFYQTIRTVASDICDASVSSLPAEAKAAATAATSAGPTDPSEGSLSLNSKGTQKIKEEHRISSREYHSLLEQRDLSRVDLIKENVTFMFEDTYFEVGCITSPKCYSGVAIMYVNHKKGSPLPDFLEDCEDVTDKDDYSSYNMAAKSEAEVSGTPKVTPKSNQSKKAAKKKAAEQEEQLRNGSGELDSSKSNGDAGDSTASSPQRKHSESEQPDSDSTSAAANASAEKKRKGAADQI